jgi:hypothetical protein
MHERHYLLSRLVLVLIAGAPFLSAAGCKKVTETVVAKGVQAAKQTVKGIEEGVDKGRKGGESLDDAIIVSRSEDLKGNGNLAIRAVREKTETGVEIEIVVENITARPLRVTNLEVLGLDKDGFARRPLASVPELTVPPKAKDRLIVRFQAGPPPLRKVRIWGTDHDVPGA